MTFPGKLSVLIKSAQDEQGTDGAFDYIQYHQAKAMRQAPEWGLRDLQGSFTRLKDRVLLEERVERKIML